MTDDASPSAPRPRLRSRLGLAVQGAAICLILLTLLAATLYLNRRAAARELLVGWLDRRGIDAQVEVERLELSGFVGRIVIGDARDPDFRVERVEVDYALGLPWSKTGLGVKPSRIRLLRPLAKVSWKQGRLSLGSLDPLIEEFARRPPGPEAPGPLVIVEGGQARIDTEYGPVRVLADARIDDGKLMRLSALMPAASLKSDKTEARGLGGVLQAATTGDRTAVTLSAQAEAFALPGTRGERVDLRLSGTLPYPDMKTRRGDGQVDLNGRLTAGMLDAGGTQAADAAADLNFAGTVEGWLNAYRLEGEAAGSATAERLHGAALDVRRTRLDLARVGLGVSGGAEAKTLSWRAAASTRMAAASGRIGDLQLSQATASSDLTAGGRGRAFEVEGPTTLAIGRLASGRMALNGARGRAEVDVVRDSATRITVVGGLGADRASAPVMGAAQAGDIPEVAEFKRALGGFSLEAPQVRLVSDNAGTALSLLRPVIARPANGGELRIAAASGPVLALSDGGGARGAFSLTSTRGGGLPEARFDGVQWRSQGGGFAARLQGRAALDFGPARDIAFSAQGELAASGGRLTYRAGDCIPLTVGRLDLGENSVEAVAGRLCPTAAPLITAANGEWGVRGRLAGGAAVAPFLEMKLSEAEGDLAVDGSARGLSMRAGVRQAQVTDAAGGAAGNARFLPLAAQGEARLAEGVWTGGFGLARKGRDIGRIDLRHDVLAGAGGAVLSAPDLVFSEYGLQPDDLSPLVADYVKSPVAGSAGFEGRFDWTGAGATSSGVLTVPELDFASPAGQVEGLKGRIEFVSLTPLITAPDQRLTADRIKTFAPLTDLAVTFGLDETALTIDGAQVMAAGGRVSVEPLQLPLTPGRAWGGVVVVEGVQLNDFLKGANLQDKAELDAVVSGRLPFTYDPQAGWRVSGGVLNAVRPGRLSIQPEVFDDLGAGGASAGLPPNTMQDLAYQAMQDLAISDLTADVNSLDGGRLGVSFRISGRHDPPEHEELRLTLMDVIRRDFLHKKLNLPSDTPIDLTLDTTWNANQIVADLLEYARRGQAPEAAADETP